MRILITGNIASGKSTLIAALIERLYEDDIVMAHISIDSMRELYSNGTAEGETLARKRFTRAVHAMPDSFIECCPYSLAYNSIIDTVGYTVLVVCDTATCLQRHQARAYYVPLQRINTDVYYVMRMGTKVAMVVYDVLYDGGTTCSVYTAILNKITESDCTE